MEAGVNQTSLRKSRDGSAGYAADGNHPVSRDAIGLRFTACVGNILKEDHAIRRRPQESRIAAPAPATARRRRS